MRDDTSPDAASRPVLTPSTLNRLVRDLLADAFPAVWVEGELSNLARPASGHIYFTLKDARAQIRCAMFKPRSTWLKFRPADGDQVLVHARVGLYEARGDYQLIVEHMEPAGEGALRRQFDELKARLAAEGLFDDAAKKPLPRFPRRIGVITSPSGAAIRDVLQVLARRFPLAEVDVLPVPVQGTDAAPAIVAMLHKANSARLHDVLLITRGGGSLEDLAPFNDEQVARAIHASTIPVLSAVGHEIDFTIGDFVADLRAPTPSAAAELLVPDGSDILARLTRQRQRISNAARHQLDVRAQHLDHVLARLQAQGPAQRLARHGERLAAVTARLRQCAQRDMQLRAQHLAAVGARLNACQPGRTLARRQQELAQYRHRLEANLRWQLDRQQSRLAQVRRALQAVSPLATLERGYAIMFDTAGHAIRSASAVPQGTNVTARLADGTMRLKRTDNPTPRQATDGQPPDD